MAFESHNMKFRLFKETNPKTPSSPPYSGYVVIDGVKYYINAWVDDSPAVGKYFSGTVRKAQVSIPVEAPPIEDDIPF